MFGYVRAHKPELRMAEYEYYRAAYCGLCRSMGKCTGQCSRMTLSYDFAFLALVRQAISGESAEFRRRRCIAHPLHRRTMMERNDVLCHSAYSAALLSYHKLRDDLADEKGAKKLRARLSLPFVKKMRKKALKKGGLTELDSSIAARLEELSEFERSGKEGIDAPAEIFGRLLSDIVAFGYEGSNERIARSIGYHVGKWIYIADALDDLDEDIEKGRYNPFSLTYKRALNSHDKELVAQALRNELASAEAAFDLIDYGDNARLHGVVNNVIYLGMPGVIEKIIKNEDCRKKGHFEIDERSV